MKNSNYQTRTSIIDADKSGNESISQVSINNAQSKVTRGNLIEITIEEVEEKESASELSI
jgi:hypothetical protein